MIDGVTESSSELSPALQGVTEKTYGLAPAMDSATSSVSTFDVTTETAMQNVETNVDTSLENVKNNISTFSKVTAKGFYDWALNIATNVRLGFESVAKNVYAALNNAKENIVNFIPNTANAFKEWCSNVYSNILSMVKGAGTAVGKGLKCIWENICKLAENIGVHLTTAFVMNIYISQQPEFKNFVAAAGLALIPFLGGASAALVLPALATGAVLPPNKPFMAVVGDQKNGTNIEAPAELIKQMAKEAIAESGFNGQATKEEHYYLNETQLMSIVYKLFKGGERLNGNSLIGGAY